MIVRTRAVLKSIAAMLRLRTKRRAGNPRICCGTHAAPLGNREYRCRKCQRTFSIDRRK